MGIGTKRPSFAFVASVVALQTASIPHHHLMRKYLPKNTNKIKLPEIGATYEPAFEDAWDLHGAVEEVVEGLVVVVADSHR